MNIRPARKEDLPALNCLLEQVLQVHHEGRPDIFKPDTKKYTDEELLGLIANEMTPIFVGEVGGEVFAYAFCVRQETEGHLLFQDRKSLYIDDLCVREGCRGQGLGKAILDYVIAYAEAMDYDSITLNVWACNESALRFYQKQGLLPLKYGMEKQLRQRERALPGEGK